MHVLMLVGIVLLIVAACGRPAGTLGVQRGPEGVECREALAVRAEFLERLDREHAAAVKARPAARAALDRVRDDARRDVAAAIDLGACEDGDPSSGITVDVANLRQRLIVVADRASVQLRGERPATGGKDTGSSDSGD